MALNKCTMRITSWDVWGTDRKGFQHQLKDVLKYNYPEISTLLETRVKIYIAEQIIKSLNMPNFVEIQPEDFLVEYGYCGRSCKLSIGSYSDNQ